MLRLTAQRQAILDLINRSDQHWDAEELARSLSDQGQSIGIATIYRGLSALESEGLISSIRLADRKRYERADKSHHDHLVCTACGSIQEFMQPKIERLQEAVAQEYSFKMLGHQLVIFGVCLACHNDVKQEFTK
ncbi:MAG: transcriptional repressor [Mariprofundaceae bacterium]